MASKGTRTTQKRISAPSTAKVKRKENRFLMRARPGAHRNASSVPLGLVLRDLLKITKNAREAKIALNSGKVLVDGRPRKESRFPIGLFDVITLVASEKAYRTLYDSKGRISFIEIPEKEAGFKLCRITGKKKAKTGNFQLTASDGSNYFEEKSEAKTGDTLKVKLPERKAIERYALAKGSIVYVTGGKHVSETAKVIEITAGTLQREALITLESGEKEFQTTASNVFVIGEKKAEIQLEPKGE